MQARAGAAIVHGAASVQQLVRCILEIGCVILHCSVLDYRVIALVVVGCWLAAHRLLADPAAHFLSR